MIGAPSITPLIFEMQPQNAVNCLINVCNRAVIQRERLTVEERGKRFETELKFFVEAIIALLKDPDVHNKVSAANWIRRLGESFKLVNHPQIRFSFFSEIGTHMQNQLIWFCYNNFPQEHPLYPSADSLLWIGRNSPVGC